MCRFLALFFLHCFEEAHNSQDDSIGAWHNLDTLFILLGVAGYSIWGPDKKRALYLRYYTYINPSDVFLYETISYASETSVPIHHSGTHSIDEDDDNIIAPSNISLYKDKYSFDG